MLSAKEINRKIKSTKSTKKITKAMEVVSASKMKRSVAQTMSSKDYAKAAWNILSNINLPEDAIENNNNNDQNKILLLVISSDRGLCGSYNFNIIKESIKLIIKYKKDNYGIDVITVGKKSQFAFTKLGENIIASFEDFSDKIDYRKSNGISNLLISIEKNYSKTFVIYTDFISTLNQKVTIKQILPIINTQEEPISKLEYKFEPSTNLILPLLKNKIIRFEIYQILLESSSSEHLLRMIAMKNAGDSAQDMIEELSVTYNKSRQASITQEISEISAGMMNNS